MKSQEQESINSQGAEDLSAHYDNFLELINTPHRFNGSNGIFVDALVHGGASGSMEITERILNTHGAVHGGALTTLADVVAGMVAATMGYSCVTLSNTMNYLREARSGKVYCTAKLIKPGRKIFVCDVELTDDGDHLVATGTYTFYTKGKATELTKD